MLGHVLAMSGRYEEALDAMTRATRWRPPLARPYICRAGVLAHAGRYEEAIESYEMAAKLLTTGAATADEEAERDEEEEARVALALEYCRCRRDEIQELKELDAILNEKDALEAELADLTVMNRINELRTAIEQLSANESTVLAGEL